MASITEPKADFAALAERLQSVARALRNLPADHPQFSEELVALGDEIKAVSVEIRGVRRPASQ
jgi:hypothetical protein